MEAQSILFVTASLQKLAYVQGRDGISFCALVVFLPFAPFTHFVHSRNITTFGEFSFPTLLCELFL